MDTGGTSAGMSRGRIVMLLSNDGVSDPRVEKEAAALIRAGWAVTVLAWDRSGNAPAHEVKGAVSYERLGPRAPYGAGLRSLPRFLAFWRQSSARAVELEPFAIHCHDLDTAPAGLRAWSRGGPKPLVLDMHELYRDSSMVPQRGLPGFLARFAVRLLERVAFRRADAIVVANPGTLEYYEQLGAGDKTVVVPNAPDHRLFVPSEREGGADGRFVVGYFGQKRYVAPLRLLVEVVRADERLGAILAGGGTGAQDVERMAAGEDRIEVSGRFAYDDLPAMYRRCDAVHAVYDTSLGNVRTLFPVKVMEAMACALPVIVADGTWVAEYVRHHNIGVVVPDGDGAALRLALATLAEDPEGRRAMGQRGRRLVEDGLNWSSAAGRLVALYEQLHANSTPPRTP